MSINTTNIIIGGGFYGCRIALFLKQELGEDVIILEKDANILRRASYNNQARVHNGYHYPRSVLTAIRSRCNFPRFVKEYEDCIDNTFLKLYAVARYNSKVNARQFYNFFNRIDAPIDVASDQYRNLFAREFVEEVFVTQEFAFDSSKMAELMRKQLDECNIPLITSAEVNKIEFLKSDQFLVDYVDSPEPIVGKRVFNCTYANLNQILMLADSTPVRMKNEMTELCLTQVPEELDNVGVTVMDGAFFSVMPFPHRKLHTLSHVRYTPHYYWYADQEFVDSKIIVKEHGNITNFSYMRQDASRFLPLINECVYKDSLWEVKTVLQKSEGDDSRPILMQKVNENKNFYSVLGGKIDNIYDIEAELKHLSNE